MDAIIEFEPTKPAEVIRVARGKLLKDLEKLMGEFYDTTGLRVVDINFVVSRKAGSRLNKIEKVIITDILLERI